MVVVPIMPVGLGKIHQASFAAMQAPKRARHLARMGPVVLSGPSVGAPALKRRYLVTAFAARSARRHHRAVATVVSRGLLRIGKPAPRPNHLLIIGTAAQLARRERHNRTRNTTQYRVSALELAPRPRPKHLLVVTTAAQFTRRERHNRMRYTLALRLPLMDIAPLPAFRLVDLGAPTYTLTDLVP
jgi:hypothetical protein